MLILTEKPSVTRDFAEALGCSYSASFKCYADTTKNIFLTNCVGHLYELKEPSMYDEKFKNWKKLPVLPVSFQYCVNPALKQTAATVVKLLKKHKKDEILVATDADREGEIIARECLDAAGITDYSRIKRFWVSQALTKDVIIDGINKAKPLGFYDQLAAQGFARQHADWLVGINGSRFISNKSGCVMPVGRVQTAVLNVIRDRCSEISHFKCEKYFEFSGVFTAPHGAKVYGKYLDSDNQSRFPNPDKLKILQGFAGKKAQLKVLDVSKKEVNPPLLYNLNELQKDAFRYFGYSAEKTLNLVQKLYENYKCVSYPRTPSRVMGGQNVQLCQELYKYFLSSYLEYRDLSFTAKISASNKRIFNDEKLESHHALIPLKSLPGNATGEEECIYNLILERFMIAFGPVSIYEKTSVLLDVDGLYFKVTGAKTIEEGWKSYLCFTKSLVNKEDEQNLCNIDWNSLELSEVTSESKKTKPPKHFNEAAILSFMENPKGDNPELNLIGLGTPATRHTFVPKLVKSGYLEIKDKNLITTEKGEKFLDSLINTPLGVLTDVYETSRWEEKLNQDPKEFEKEIRNFILSWTGGSNE